MKDENKPKKQHWVPQSYLRYFRDPATTLEKPFVWLFKKDKAFRSPILVPTKTIFYEEHLYTVETPDGERHYEVEEAYAKSIDAKYPPVIQKIEKREPLSEGEHKTLCTFVAAQLLRTPQVRDSFIDFMNRVAEMGERMAEAHGTESKQAKEIRQHSKNLHTLNTVELIPEIATVLYRMNIALGCAPEAGRRFITSDNPVFMRNPDLQWQRFWGPGLGQKRIEVYFPASPTTLIIFTWQNYRGYVHLGNGWVSEMNRWIQNHAMDWFVASSKKPQLYWFSKYPADPFFLLKIAKFQLLSLMDRLKRRV